MHSSVPGGAGVQRVVEVGFLDGEDVIVGRACRVEEVVYSGEGFVDILLPDAEGTYCRH